VAEREVRIVAADTAEQRLEVSKLRYRIFVEELGWQIPGARPESMFDETDEGSRIFLAYEGDEAVGTGAIKCWADGPIAPATVKHLALDEFEKHVSRDKIALGYKGLVKRSHRKSDVFVRLGLTAFDALGPSVEFSFVESSPYLVPLYEAVGYRRYTSDFTYEGTGVLTVPLVLVLCDHEYLDRIGSVATGVAARVAPNPKSLAYFKEHWALPDRPAPNVPPSIEDAQGAALLDGFAPADVARFVALARRVPFQRRDVLIQPGGDDSDLFFVREGYVEIAIPKEHRSVPVATQGPGSIFGEMRLLLGTPRTALVRALTAGELLRVPAADLDRFTAAHPALAALLYRNMSRILAERLRDRSQWIDRAPPL
jgi:hypothetical protein